MLACACAAWHCSSGWMAVGCARAGRRGQGPRGRRARRRRAEGRATRRRRFTVFQAPVRSGVRRAQAARMRCAWRIVRRSCRARNGSPGRRISSTTSTSSAPRRLASGRSTPPTASSSSMPTSTTRARSWCSGCCNFGLDPDDIKYIIITHAHDDRYWGAKALQDTYPNARVAMSAADWDLVAKDNSPAQFKPRKDMVITDGQQITLGEVTVTAYVTPGHTPGTLSLIVGPLTESRRAWRPTTGGMWPPSGAATDASIGRQGVRYYPDGQAMMKAHVTSMQALHGSGDESRRRRDPVYRRWGTPTLPRSSTPGGS